MGNGLSSIVSIGSWAHRKVNRHGDPLDTPKQSKADAGYVVPPDGTQIQCGTCSSFREPDGCALVGNEGAIIYRNGCCNRWSTPGAMPSTYEDPNPNDLTMPAADDDEED